jgi:hypothetical protein
MAISRIQDAEQVGRARDYWKADGIPTLVAGVLYLAVGGLLWVFSFVVDHIDLLKRNWFFDSLVGPIGALLFATSPFWIIGAVIWLSVNWEDLIEWFKVRITYPRTGYVAPPSYWPNESAPPLHPKAKSWFWKVLSVLGGFSFWLLVVILLGFDKVMNSRPILILLFGLLVAIRGIRVGLYPEAAIPDHANKSETKLQLSRFMWSTLNAFWVWVFLARLLPDPGTVMGHLPPLVPAGLLLLLALGAFAIFLPNMGHLRATALCLCGVGCAFLLWKSPHVGMPVVLLFPGLWAAGIGSLRLYRYLRANPLHSI